MTGLMWWLPLLAGGLQADATVHGVVRADSTAEPVPYAMVEVGELGRRVSADEHGFYIIPDLAPGVWTLRAAAIGHEDAVRIVEVPADGAIRVDFRLPARPIAIAALEVVAPGFDAAQAAGPGEMRMTAREIALVPALAETDVLRAVQTLPSVQTVSDFSTGLYVRGGSPDQTLVTLDGAPLFNPYHLGGIFAAIDPGAVASVEVLPGAMPASVGDRLSSTVQIWTRDGGRDRVRGQGAIGLISVRAGIDGPLPGARGSYLVSVRRTYVDLAADLAQAVGLLERSIPYGFTDAHVKLTHDLPRSGRLSASFYVDAEEFEDRGEGGGADDKLTWASRTASISYRQPLTSSLFGEARLGYSGFGSTVEIEEASGDAARPVANIDGDMRDLFAAFDLTWREELHEVRTGVQLDAYRFSYDVRRDDDFFLADLFPEFRRTDEVMTIAAYLEDEWMVTEVVTLRGGIRVLHGIDIGTQTMPRLGAEWAISPRLTLNFGAGRYAQAVHSLRDEESLAASFLAYDLLVAARGPEGLEVADDLVLGAEWASDATRLRLDVFAKRMSDVLLPPLPPEPLDAPVVSPGPFRRGETTVHGLELLARHRWRGVSAQGAYTLSFVGHEVGGESFAPRYERRHTLDLNGAIGWGDAGTFSARLVLATGQPATPVLAAIQAFDHNPLDGSLTTPGYLDYVLGEHNSERLPAYWRLDVAARKAYQKEWFGRSMTITPYLQILNVLAARNVVIAEPSAFGQNAGNAGVLKYTSQLPFLPSFGVEWSF